MEEWIVGRIEGLVDGWEDGGSEVWIEGRVDELVVGEGIGGVVWESFNLLSGQH